MGYINVKLPDDLETKFRVKVAKLYGGKKGALTQAVTEAIKQWVEDENNE